MDAVERIVKQAEKLEPIDLMMLHRAVSRLAYPIYRKAYPGQWETGMAAAKAKQAVGYQKYREQRERDERAATS